MTAESTEFNVRSTSGHPTPTPTMTVQSTQFKVESTIISEPTEVVNLLSTVKPETEHITTEKIGIIFPRYLEIVEKYLPTVCF